MSFAWTRINYCIILKYIKKSKPFYFIYYYYYYFKHKRLIFKNITFSKHNCNIL